MALALQDHPAHRRTARRASHLRLVLPAEQAPVRASRAVSPPAPRRRSTATYFRRRLAVGLVLVALAGSYNVATRAQANGDISTPVEQRYVIAQDGDNLWAIAERIAPTGNIPDIVDQLEALNGTSLRVGQVVLIP